MSKRNDTDGIVSLITADVRAIGEVKTEIKGEDVVKGFSCAVVELFE